MTISASVTPGRWSFTIPVTASRMTQPLRQRPRRVKWALRTETELTCSEEATSVAKQSWVLSYRFRRLKARYVLFAAIYLILSGPSRGCDLPETLHCLRRLWSVSDWDWRQRYGLIEIDSTSLAEVGAFSERDGVGCVRWQCGFHQSHEASETSDGTVEREPQPAQPTLYDLNWHPHCFRAPGAASQVQQ